MVLLFKFLDFQEALQESGNFDILQNAFLVHLRRVIFNKYERESLI